MDNSGDDGATRRALLRAAGGAALTGLAGTGRAQPAAPLRTIDMTSYLVAPAPAAATVKSFVAKASELTAGALVIEPQFMTGLSRPLTVLSVDSPLSYFLSIQGGESDPLLGLSSLPMLAQSFDEAQTLLEVARPWYDKALQRFDLALLAADPWRPPALWSVKPIASGADLRGTAFDLMGMAYNARWNLPLERAGARYSPFAAQMMLTWPHDRNVAMHEPLYSFYTEIFLAAQLNFLVVGRRFLDELSAAQREALVEAGRFAEAEAWQARRELVVREQKEIAGWGCTVTPVPPRALVAALREAAEPDIARWAEQVGADGQTLLADYRRAIGR